jgi:hypothetical protein
VCVFGCVIEFRVFVVELSWVSECFWLFGVWVLWVLCILIAFLWFVRLFPQKIEGVRGKECEKFSFLCFCSAQLDSTKLMWKIRDWPDLSFYFFIFLFFFLGFYWDLKKGKYEV